MVHPNTAGPGGKNRPYKASVWEREWILICQRLVFPVHAIFGHTRLPLVKDHVRKLQLTSVCVSPVLFPTVSELWWHAHAKSKKSLACCLAENHAL